MRPETMGERRLSALSITDIEWTANLMPTMVVSPSQHAAASHTLADKQTCRHSSGHNGTQGHAHVPVAAPAMEAACGNASSSPSPECTCTTTSALPRLPGAAADAAAMAAVCCGASCNAAAGIAAAAAARTADGGCTMAACSRSEAAMAAAEELLPDAMGAGDSASVGGWLLTAQVTPTPLASSRRRWRRPYNRCAGK